MDVLVGSGMMVLLKILSLKLADSIRMQGFERLSKETIPLIAGINDYHEKFG